MLESLFNEVISLKASNFVKKRLQHICFSMNLAKILRITFLYFFDRTPPVAASKVTTYLKYTFSYLLNYLVYPWNSADHVKTLPIIFANLYYCI